MENIEILYENDEIIIRINRPKKLIEYKWKKFVSKNIFKKSLERVYNNICGLDVDKCLIDRTRLGFFPSHMQNWWENTWFPRIKDSGIKKIAVVSAPSSIRNLWLTYLAQEEILRARN